MKLSGAQHQPSTAPTTAFYRITGAAEFWRAVRIVTAVTAGVLAEFASTAIAAPGPEPIQIVDLHAHYFMQEASGLPWGGRFDGPVTARDWSDRLESRVNQDAAANSQVRIAVVSLYSHPLYWRSQRDVIRTQIQETERFVAKNPAWVIVRSPQEAREKLQAGKKLILLAIEGVSGIVETEADVQEFVDRRGVRIITPMHFSDDAVGGAAFMPGWAILANPLAALESYFSPNRDSLGLRVNPQGLTENGKSLIRTLVDHGAWIDFSHASDATIRDIRLVLEEKKQPALYTHTILRNSFRGERGISTEQLEQIKNSGGILGLLPSDDMLKGTAVDPKLCPASCKGVCHGGIAAFLTQYQEISRVVPPASILLGSDVNAPLTFLQPGCPAMEREQPQGYWNYAQLPDLAAALRSKELLPKELPSDYMVQSFLQAWEKALKQ